MTTGGGPPASADDVIADLANNVAELIAVFDQGATLLWFNARVEQALGWPSEWIGRSGIELLHPDDIALALELLVSAQATGPGVKEPVMYRLVRGDGEGWADMEIVSSIVELTTGEVILILSGRPAGQARPPTAIFDEASSRVSAMFDEALIGMAQVALDGDILRANRELAAIVGAVGAGDLLGASFAALLLDGGDGLLQGSGGYFPQARIGDRFVRLSSTLVHDHRGDPMYYAVQVSDITDLVLAQQELAAAEAELVHRSTHDALTGLANRTLLDAWALRAAADEDAVLFVDLDGFKAVNDTFGHAAGDRLLVAVAARLRAEVRRTDLLARIGGDEFIVICPDTGHGEAEDLAARIVAVVSQPVETARGTITIGASVGVAMGAAGLTYDALLDLADSALYRAKRAGGPRVVVANVG